jgi:riboflavin biosynthesis pyrimidine reductase
VQRHEVEERGLHLVLVGAESVRSEGYLRPRRAALAIVTASGDLRGHRLEDPPSNPAGQAAHPVIVLTTDRGAARASATMPSARVLVLDGEQRLDERDVLAALRRAGYGRIVAEGGPSLAAQLLEAGLVDELCLTVMPRVGGPALPLLTVHAVAISDLHADQVLLDEHGTIFGRWAVSERATG